MTQIVNTNMPMYSEKEVKIIAAARTVFLRYGYKRTTMGDIATEAAISRPALYLLYPSKEELFVAVAESMYTEQLAKITQYIDQYPTDKAKLLYAFEVWCVQPFALLLTSPLDARDLLASSAEVAAKITKKSVNEFEAIVAGFLEDNTSTGITALRKAHLLHNAIPGFKGVAKTPEELRSMIEDLVTLVAGS
jgi:AcrR family transcriptional regulator